MHARSTMIAGAALVRGELGTLTPSCMACAMVECCIVAEQGKLIPRWCLVLELCVADVLLVSRTG